MTRLRRVEAGDVAALDGEHDDRETAGEYAWWGFRDSGRIAREFGSGQLIKDDGGMLVVADDAGLLVGGISWRMSTNGPPPFGSCWNIGIWIAPEHRGKGHGSESQRLLAAYLFDHTLMERVEASTESGNIGEQRALEKAGFSREGVQRHACFRAGEWRDMVVFSKLRGES